MEGDGDYWTVEALKHMDACVPWIDPAKDRIIAEVDGQMIGAGRVESARTDQGERIYFHSCNLLPEWRGKGIGTAVLKHNERRLRQIAASHPKDGPRFFQTYSVPRKQAATERLLVHHGYSVERHFNEMVRPTMDNIPDRRLPSGLELRPVDPSHLRALWDTNREAFRDHWCSWPRPESAFAAWCTDPFWLKELTAVAWEKDQCVGMVLAFASEEENASKGRMRLYTESICVRRPWRHRGVAFALIAHCLQLGQRAGFTEAGFGVDSENLSGALRLYESLGYRPVKQSTIYRKAMN